MNYAIEGIYNNGSIELIEKPDFPKPVGVLIIFLENKKKISKLGGLFKNAAIDYDGIKQDLAELRRNSSAHILEEFERGQ